MALETLKDSKTIDGFTVLNIDKLAKENPDKWDAENRRFDWDWFKKNVYPNGNYIIIDEHKNSITFKLQNGPIKENGVNGCQVDTIVATVSRIMEGLNEKFSSRFNELALANLNTTYAALKFRKEDREDRGVEGYNKE